MLAIWSLVLLPFLNPAWTSGGEGNGTPLQYSCLENPMDGGAWKAAVHGVAECRTWLSDFTFTFNFHALEKEMATHFSVLAWRIPGTGEPGGLLSMGSHRVGHDWSNLAAAAAISLREEFRIIYVDTPDSKKWGLIPQLMCCVYQLTSKDYGKGKMHHLSGESWQTWSQPGDQG